MRRKLIEQITNTYYFLQKMSAGTTTAHVSIGIDRDGFLSARLCCQAQSMTVADTQTFDCYIFDSSDNSTFAAYVSATYTVSVAPSYSASETGDSSYGGVDIDLAGANRYLQIYCTVTGASTVTAMLSACLVLGDAITEPATA